MVSGHAALEALRDLVAECDERDCFADDPARLDAARATLAEAEAKDAASGQASETWVACSYTDTNPQSIGIEAMDSEGRSVRIVSRDIPRWSDALIQAAGLDMLAALKLVKQYEVEYRTWGVPGFVHAVDAAIVKAEGLSL